MTQKEIALEHLKERKRYWLGKDVPDFDRGEIIDHFIEMVDSGKANYEDVKNVGIDYGLGPIECTTDANFRRMCR